MSTVRSVPMVLRRFCLFRQIRKLDNAIILAPSTSQQFVSFITAQQLALLCRRQQLQLQRVRISLMESYLGEMVGQNK